MKKQNVQLVLCISICEVIYNTISKHFLEHDFTLLDLVLLSI